MENTLFRERSVFQRIAIVLAVVCQIGSTFLPAFGMGEQIGARSDSVRTLITPSGWAFSIWGPLFLGSLVFAIWQALPGQRRNALLGTIGWPAAIALAAQGVWAMYTQFNNLTVISAVIIFTSLIGLLVVLRALGEQSYFTHKERWIVALVFSGLAAWLTAASIVNVSATLVYSGVLADGPYPLVTAIMVAIGGIIAALATVRSRGNPWYALVFCWALTAIYFRGGQEDPAIAWACIGSGIMVALAAFIGLSTPSNRRHWLGV
ncbi:hypothetical protein FGU71_02255 [Erythrobacter insulae]|uniref:Tryptophan-rich sensory protein n=1 Tax=Erythrobacter insulae TaxID=2584124 RepID=A0A547P9T5_9SPHN|nr:hypothetical protein [Erythrobacter insulae]TRD10804.1 hypothetical protein FGU71_02255 [Erythrobacter insulae]